MIVSFFTSESLKTADQIFKKNARKPEWKKHMKPTFFVRIRIWIHAILAWPSRNDLVWTRNRDEMNS